MVRTKKLKLDLLASVNLEEEIDVIYTAENEEELDEIIEKEIEEVEKWLKKKLKIILDHELAQFKSVDVECYGLEAE